MENQAMTTLTKAEEKDVKILDRAMQNAQKTVDAQIQAALESGTALTDDVTGSVWTITLTQPDALDLEFNINKVLCQEKCRIFKGKTLYYFLSTQDFLTKN